MNYTVSVVIPCYRSRGTIDRALKSVEVQTLIPLEVWVVIDGDEDDTSSFLRDSYNAGKLSGILKVITLQSNFGVSCARNKGWALSKGDYIAFLDADDEWEPNKLETQLSLISRFPDITLCGHGFHFKSDTGFSPLPRVKMEAKDFFFLNKVRILFSNPFVTPSVVVRRDIPFRFKAGRRHMEDHLLWMEIALAGYKVVKINAPLAILGKAQFGESGLSADLWAMGIADLGNYHHLWLGRKIGFLLYVFFVFYSWSKFIRRLNIVGFRKLYGKFSRSHQER